MKKKILLISDSTFIKKNFLSFHKNDNTLIISENEFFKNIILVKKKIKKFKPDYTIVKAGLSGGILFNIKNSLKILEYNCEVYIKVLKILSDIKIKKVFFISASCLYPKIENTSISEKHIFSGKFEETNLSYSISMSVAYGLIDGINKKKNYKYVNIIPATLYGPHQKTTDTKESHVLTAIINKFRSKSSFVKLYGNGKPKREFLFIDDLFDAISFLNNIKIFENVINVGTGKDYTINEIVSLVKKIFRKKQKNVIWDKSKPNGVMRKLLNTKLIRKYGWRNKYNLEMGLKKIRKLDA